MSPNPESGFHVICAERNSILILISTCLKEYMNAPILLELGAWGHDDMKEPTRRYLTSSHKQYSAMATRLEKKVMSKDRKDKIMNREQELMRERHSPCHHCPSLQ